VVAPSSIDVGTPLETINPKNLTASRLASFLEEHAPLQLLTRKKKEEKSPSSKFMSLNNFIFSNRKKACR